MSEPFPLWLVPLLFVPSFIALWLFVTSLLAWISGWFRLQAEFPDREAPVVVATLRFRTGQVGLVGYHNSLTFDVCTDGLRVRVWKLHCPLSRPFFVPWREIGVRHKRQLLFSGYWLGFGLPEQGRLSVSARTATELARLSGGLLKLPDPVG